MVKGADPHVFTARLPEEVFEKLRVLAFMSRRSMNEIVIRALQAYFKDEMSEEELIAMLAAQERLREE